ncbi:hypothetical protein ACLB2K_053083 [Fragaria x ananassa]
MLILAVYDGLSPVEDVSLNTLEVWILVVGLRFAMRNPQVLGWVRNDLGGFVRADPGPIKWKEKVQQVRVVLDVRNRIPVELTIRRRMFMRQGVDLWVVDLSLVNAVMADGVSEFVGEPELQAEELRRRGWRAARWRRLWLKYPRNFGEKS